MLGWGDEWNSGGKEKTQMVLKSAQPMRKGRAGAESELEKQFSVLNHCLYDAWVCEVAKQIASLLTCASNALTMKSGSMFLTPSTCGVLSLILAQTNKEQ